MGGSSVGRALTYCVACSPVSNFLVRNGANGVIAWDAILNSQGHSSTDLGGAVKVANKKGYDRLIVLTDEQSQTPVGAPDGKGYMVNVASYQHGVGYGQWLHLDGFSESVVRWIQAYESEFAK